MRPILGCLVVAGLLIAGSPAERAFAADQPIVRARTAEFIQAAASGPRGPGMGPSDAGRLQRLPPVERPIQRVQFVEPAREPAHRAAQAVAHQAAPNMLREPEEVIGKLDEPNTYLIDLPTALRLADANNLLVAAAREQIAVAMARVDAASALWLPSVRGGTNYNRHDGAIQDVHGIQFNTTRVTMRRGGGHLWCRNADHSGHLRQLSFGRRAVSTIGGPAVCRLAKSSCRRRDQQHAVASHAHVFRADAGRQRRGDCRGRAERRAEAGGFDQRLCRDGRRIAIGCQSGARNWLCGWSTCSGRAKHSAWPRPD